MKLSDELTRQIPGFAQPNYIEIHAAHLARWLIVVHFGFGLHFSIRRTKHLNVVAPELVGRVLESVVFQSLLGTSHVEFNGGGWFNAVELLELTVHWR